MKRTLSFLFKLVIFSLSTLGVYVTLKDALYPFEALSYFTTIINMLTALFYAFFIVEMVLRKDSSRLFRYFKQSLMVYLIITMVVYSFILIPFIVEEQINYQIFSVNDVLIHYIVPLTVLIDYGWFDEKGKTKSIYAFTNLLNIVFYVMYLFLYVFFGGRFHLGNTESMYPYFFLNIERLGLYPVMLICLGIMVVVIFVGWLIYIIDQLISIPLNLSTDKRK
jgi:hypothetical protein